MTQPNPAFNIHQSPASALRAGVDHSVVRALAEKNLQKALTTGHAGATNVIERVMSEVPHDQLAQARVLRVRISDNDRAPHLIFPDESKPLHGHAFDQLAERLGLPRSYVHALLETVDKPAAAGPQGAPTTPPDPWRARLLEHAFDQHLQHSPDRYLVRSVDGTAKGVLSDRFKRYDSRPLLEAFAEGCAQVGAIPVDGVGGEVRLAVRAIIPTVLEPVPGEFVTLGLEWRNSDFGAGAYAINAYLLRCACLNGVVVSREIRAVHVGGRLDESTLWSDRTKDLDLKTLVSQTRDAVAGLLGEQGRTSLFESIQRAHAAEITPEAAGRTLAKKLTKAETGSVIEAFKGDDVVNLPPVQSRYRLSQAISWLANRDGTSEERRLELQTVAGDVMAA
jgi:hypothetical protein